jgi:hypothetical protein
MRGGKAKAGLALCAAATTLFAPSSAAAGSTAAAIGLLGAGPGPSRSFALKGSNGYSISVQGSRRVVFLTASRGSAVANYITRGRATSRRIKARFGNLGRISVRFKPSGKVKRTEPPRRCRGKDKVTTFGVFVGKVKFTGELGYTRVNARRVKGSVSTSPGRRCRALPVRHGPSTFSRRLKLTVLSASGSQQTVGFEAIRLDGLPLLSSRIAFVASSIESRGSMLVLRSTYATGRAQTFTFDKSLGAATVAPPAPFTGTASFERGGPRESPFSATWSGSLTAPLPGMGTVPLTGLGFTASLIQRP